MEALKSVVTQMQGRRLEDIIARDTKLFEELTEARELADMYNSFEFPISTEEEPVVRVCCTTLKNGETRWYLGYNQPWPHEKATLRTSGRFVEDN